MGKQKGVPKPESDVMNVRLTPDARRAVDDLTARYLTQKTKLVERVLTWFSDQPESVQHLILTTLPNEMKPAYANALRRLADEMEAKPPRITSSRKREADQPPPQLPPAPTPQPTRTRDDPE